MGKIRKRRSKRPEPTGSERNLNVEDRLDDLIHNKKVLDDDVKSNRSLKFIKNELGVKQLSKVNKTRLKRKVLLKKLGAGADNRLKKADNVGGGGSKLVLDDKLPSLSSLLVSTTDKIRVEEARKKPIPKVGKRKKNLINGVETYKNVIKSNEFKNDPIGAVLQQVRSRLDNSSL